MRSQLQYFIITSFFGLIAAAILYFAYRDARFVLIKHDDPDTVIRKQTQEIKELLQSANIVQIYFMKQNLLNDAIKQRIENYLSELVSTYHLQGIGLIGIQNDSSFIISSKGDIDERILKNVASINKTPPHNVVAHTTANAGYTTLSYLPDASATVLLFINFGKHSSEISAKFQSIYRYLLLLFAFVVVAVAILFYLNSINHPRLILAELLAIIIFGLGMSFFTWTYVNTSLELDRKKMLNDFTTGKWSALRNAFQRIGTDSHLIKALFEASIEVSEDEFKTFTRPFFQYKPFYCGFSILRANTGKQMEDYKEYTDFEVVLSASKNGQSLHSPLNGKLFPNLMESIALAAKTGLRHSLYLETGYDCDLPQPQLMLVQPISNSTKSNEFELPLFAVSFIQLNALMAELMADGNSLNATLPFGVAFRPTDNNQPILIISSIENLADFHEEKSLEFHLNKFSSFSIRPLFFGGDVFYLVAHETQTTAYPLAKNTPDLWFTIILIGTFLITLTVYSLRTGWFNLEKVVSTRTAQLNVRIKELELLRELSQKITESPKLSQALSWLCERFNKDGELSKDLALVILQNGQSVCDTCVPNLDDKQVVLRLPLGSESKPFGEMLLYALPEQNTQTEKTEGIGLFIHQLQYVINTWIAYTQAGSRLHELETHFSMLAQSSFDGIFMMKGQRFLWVNEAFCKMLGYSQDQILTENFDYQILLTPKGLQVSREHNAMYNRGEMPPARFDSQLRTADGRELDVEVSLASMDKEGQKFVLGIVRDVTDQRKLERALRDSEERLQQQNEELQIINEELTVSNTQLREMNVALGEATRRAEASDKLKTAFLNNISHEVRTPLNGICGAAEILSNPDLSHEDKVEMISILNESTQRLLRTITEYMDISLLESDNMPVVVSDFSFDNFIRPIISTYEHMARSKNLDFKFIDGIGSCSFHSDKSLLSKAIGHLLDNAVKFTEKGSVTLTVDLEQEMICFKVSDTGKGMEKQFHSKVFELFVQEDTSNRRRYDGSGLGLPIVHRITKLLGGKIEFESEPAVGTTFILKLPVQHAENKTTTTAVAPISQLKPPHILVAEDEDSNFMVLKLLLERKLKAKVSRAFNGQEAVDMVRRHNDINLTIMDVKMPLMDGYEATKLIKALKPSLPIIAVTAYALSGDEQKAIDAGCDDYIPKPIQQVTLFEKLSRFLN